MPDTVVVETSENPAADVEAARAAAAATTATEAAAAALALANVAAANNEEAARNEIATYTDGLNECRGQIAALTEAGTAHRQVTDQRFTELAAGLSSIQMQLEKLLEPPANQSNGPTADDPAGTTETVPPANDEEPPARRKAHHWI